MAKVYNFNAGPATLPTEVMQQAQEEFIDYRGLGYGIIEASHRSPDFDAVITEAEADLRQLLALPDRYATLFLQGGASMQFAMVPMNLMTCNGTADYIDTGAWSSKAFKEAAKQGTPQLVASGKDGKYTQIPDLDSLPLRANADYLHITSNNTIAGTQYARFPVPPDGVPLIADMSSDILSRRLNVEQFGVIYAGAQKNLGPSGVTLVILDKALAERSPKSLPTMLNYNTFIDKKSMFNTPPTFSIYMLGLVLKWILKQGGVEAVEAVNERKAALLYSCLDQDDFFSGPVAKESRSRMNVCFRLPTEELEAEFIREAANNGMIGLKGHRSVGGIRASIYNAMPLAGIECLVAFMNEFRARKG